MTEKKAGGGGGNGKREIKSSEDEKTRGRTAGSGRRIKQSVFFLFPKERRREEVGWDGGMRSGGETLSPAAPQDWTPKPKNPTGLPPCCWRHHGGGGAWPYKDRRGERRYVCAGVREQDEEREEGEEVPTNQSQRERSWSPHAFALSLSQSELVSSLSHHFTWLWWKSAQRSSPCGPGSVIRPWARSTGPWWPLWYQLRPDGGWKTRPSSDWNWSRAWSRAWTAVTRV